MSATQEKLLLQRPEHLTDDYELFGPTQLTILGPDVRASKRIIEEAVSLRGMLSMNLGAEPEAVTVPTVFENYCYEPARSERKKISEAWEKLMPERLGEIVAGSQVLVMPFKYRPDITLAYMLGRLSQNDNVEEIYLPIGSMNPVPNDQRIQEIITTVNMFGWRTEDGHTLRANRDNLVAADESVTA